MDKHRLLVLELLENWDRLQHDLDAYRGALGYPIPGLHDGKLTDGTTPRCGLCDAREKAAAYTRDQLKKETALRDRHPEHFADIQGKEKL